jgi:hypothetical protein
MSSGRKLQSAASDTFRRYWFHFRATFFVVFVSPSGQIKGYYTLLDHEHLLTHPFKLIIYWLSTAIQSDLPASFNKPVTK